VWWEPQLPSAGDTLSVFYDLVCRGVLPPDTNPVYIHVGHSGWQEIISPDPAMVWDEEALAWRYRYSIPGYATSVEFVFNDGAGVWDNNGGSDWSVPVSGAAGPGFHMDGSLDPEAALVAAGSALNLYAAFDGTSLYVATEGVGTTPGLDHFVFVDPDPDGSRDAPWAKQGTVAGWDYLLGNEDSNNWCGWFDTDEQVMSSPHVGQASGAYLEGVLDLPGLYGAVPESIFMAAAGYLSPDGGSLENQAPVGDGDGAIERDEYFVYLLTNVGVPIDGNVASTSGAPVLYQSCPNPAVGSAEFRLFLPHETTGTVTVHDICGRIVRDLARGMLPAGEHTVRWDGRDARGNELPSGVYLYRFSTRGCSLTRKMVFFR
jgi:hypothetical protein